MEKKETLIILRVDASHRRGMGHLYRMKTLADEFRKNNFCCLFLLRRNKTAESILDETPHEYMSYPADYFEEKIISKYFLDHRSPDLWIFDILSTQSEWIVCVKRNDVPVVCFDDLRGGLDAADLVINPITGCWNNIRTPRRTRLLSGPDYAIVDSQILSMRKGNQLPNGRIRVGVTMGGSDTHGSTLTVVRALSELGEDLDVTLFLGPHFRHEKELSETTHKLPFPCSIKRLSQELHGELVKSDVIICGGGQTLFELCAMGMCTLALANEVHEEKTISFFSQHGACIGIGSVHKRIDNRKLSEFFNKLRWQPDEVRRMKNNAEQLVDGKGTLRCFSECTNIIKRKKVSYV